MASAPPEPDPTAHTNGNNENGISRNHYGSVDGLDEFHDSAECHRECFRKLSKHIVSFDELDDLCEDEDAECMTAVNYLQKVPVETRSAVAKYLSSGRASHLTLSTKNFHDIFHIAEMLHLRQLQKACMEFYTSNNVEQILGLFNKCSLRGDLIRKSQLLQRSNSIMKESEESPKEFYCAFSRFFQKTAKGEEEITNVIVIDISEKIYAHHRQTKKLGKATKCCSSEVDMSPYIFVCGGEGTSATKTWKYDVLLGEWHKCAKLLHGRSRHIMVPDGKGSIFAIGGKEVACIEKYDIKKNKWQEKAALRTHAHSALATIYKDKIYIFGGKTPSGSISTVQRFDTSSNSVSKLDDLPCTFHGGKAVVYEEKIFIATPKGHMICFEPEVGDSYLCERQPIVRKFFGMFVKSDRIYIVGGVCSDETDGDASTQMVRYNPEEDRWKEEASLPNSFPVYSACKVKYPTRCSVIPFRIRH